MVDRLCHVYLYKIASFLPFDPTELNLDFNASNGNYRVELHGDERGSPHRSTDIWKEPSHAHAEGQPGGALPPDLVPRPATIPYGYHLTHATPDPFVESELDQSR